MRKCIAMICLICCCGLSNKYLVTTSYDQFDNITRYTLQNNILAAETAEIALRNIVWLNPCKIVRPDTTKIYLIVYHSGSEHLFIQDGMSLVMLIDGKRYEFEMLSKKWGDVETAYYGISPEQFKILAYARQVQIKIVGREYYLARAIHPAVLLKYQRFYEEMIK